jgi:hypothetical protein
VESIPEGKEAHFVNKFSRLDEKYVRDVFKKIRQE